jgi:serine phosphatase RsbU (regulator of sigma subunit)
MLNKPKNLVSGDFAWFYQFQGNKYMAIADCTGHGLAGALVSIKGYNLLNNLIKDNETDSPANILNKFNEQWRSSLKQQHELTAEDSMDILLLKYNIETLRLDYASANQRYVIIKENATSLVLEGSLYGIGNTNLADKEKLFEDKSLKIELNDTLYLFTDGFSDQFGENNQKLMFNSFLEHLKALSKYPIEKQRNILQDFFNSWKGNKQQTDDILVIGIKL